MNNDSDSEANGNHRGAAYAWRPMALLLFLTVALIYILQSDLVRTAVQTLIDGTLR